MSNMYNKDLKNNDERRLLLSMMTGVVRLNGDVTIDDDDENGHFTLTQKYTWGDKERTRIIHCQLTVTGVSND